MKFKKVDFAVEVTDFEALCLWERNKALPDDHRVEWKENTRGRSVTIGIVGGNPVCVSLFWNFLDGHPVLFYECTSRMCDWHMVEKFIKENCLNSKYTKTDAMNFPRIAREIKTRGKIENANTREQFCIEEG
jgi:hypothetical protein